MVIGGISTTINGKRMLYCREVMYNINNMLQYGGNMHEN